jgi:YD repeat-containing protein
MFVPPSYKYDWLKGDGAAMEFGFKRVLSAAVLLVTPWLAQAAVPCIVNNQLHECAAWIPTLTTYRFDIYGVGSAYQTTTGESAAGPLDLVAPGESYIAANAIPLFVQSHIAIGAKTCPPPSSALNRVPAPTSWYQRSGQMEMLRYYYAYGPWGYGAAGTPDNQCTQNPAGSSSGFIGADRAFNCPVGYTLRPDAPDAEKCYRPLRPEGQTCPAAYPVQPDTGVKRLDEADYAGAGAHPLSFARSYRSGHSLLRLSRQFGLRWSNTYSAYLERGQTYTSVHRGDGTTLPFRTDAGTTWQSAWGPRATLTATADATGAATGWILQLDDDSIEQYNAAGVLRAITQRNGWTTTLTYSTAATPVADYLAGATTAQPNLLIGVRNQFGRELKLVYDARGQLAQLLPPGAVKDGAVNTPQAPIRYGYDARGNLTTVTWQDGTVKRYHYEDTRAANTVTEFGSLLTGITDESNTRIANYAYDESGRATMSERGSDRYLFSYGGDTGTTGSQTYVTAPDNATRTYTFEAAGGIVRPTSVTAPCPACGSTQKSSVYNADGLPAKQIAHDGTVTFTTYDTKGRETERATFPASYSTATTRPALSNASKVVSTKWHATFNLPTQVAEPNKLTTNTYNAKGMLTAQSWTATTDATGAAKFNALKTGSTYATGWGYNANSLATSIVTRETAAGATVAVETQRYTIAYATNSAVTTITDVTAGNLVGRATSYDAHGRLLQGTTVFGDAVSFAYSPRGFVTSSTEVGKTTTFVQSPIGDSREVRMPDGKVVTFEIDGTRRLVAVRIDGALISSTSIRDGAPAHPYLARLLEQIESGVLAVLPTAIAQGAPANLRPLPLPVPGAPQIGQPQTTPEDVLTGQGSAAASSRFTDRDKATRRLLEGIIAMCTCDPSGGYGAPKLTPRAYAHISITGHLSNVFGNKSYFIGPINQTLVDEIANHPNRRVDQVSGNQTQYFVADMGRIIGMTRTRDPANPSGPRIFVETRSVTMFVSNDHCDSLMRDRNEVVTMHPGEPLWRR